MKKNFLALLISFFSLTLFAQQKPTDLDKSPLDVSYSPSNFPILKMNGKQVDAPFARVLYGRPQKAGRTIFGGIVNYEQVWRLGANEATEIEFFKNAKIAGKNISKGRYTMYAICHEKTWTLILNNEKDVWGLFYNAKKDAFRVDVPVQITDGVTENFTMYFEDAKDGTKLIIMWDNVRVELPITF